MTTKPVRKRPVRKVAGNPNVIQLDRPENVAKFAEREPLFSVDGVEYTIPKHVPMSWTIKATNLAVQEGQGIAQAYVAVVMLGEEGLEALQACDTLTAEDMTRVMQVLSDKVFPGTGDVAPKDS